MILINTPLPIELVKGLDRAAQTTNCDRTEIIQKAVESYLRDFDDQKSTLDQLNFSRELEIDWHEIEHYFGT